jgi:hypothetical protein
MTEIIRNDRNHPGWKAVRDAVSFVPFWWPVRGVSVIPADTGTELITMIQTE